MEGKDCDDQRCLPRGHAREHACTSCKHERLQRSFRKWELLTSDLIAIGDSGFGNVPSETIDPEARQYQGQLLRAKDWGRALPNAITAATLAPSSREREPAAAELPGNFQTPSEAWEEGLVGYMAVQAPSGRASSAAAPSAAAVTREN